MTDLPLTLPASGVMIREALEADVAGVVAVQLASWTATYKPLLPAAAFAAFLTSDMAAAWRRWLGSGLNVAERGGRIVAYLRTEHDEVPSLHVLAEAQGLGIGRAMLRLALDRIGPFRLQVIDGNDGAVAFYRRCGGAITGPRAVTLFGAAVPGVEFRFTEVR